MKHSTRVTHDVNVVTENLCKYLCLMKTIIFKTSLQRAISVPNYLVGYIKTKKKFLIFHPFFVIQYTTRKRHIDMLYQAIGMLFSKYANNFNIDRR